MYGRTNRSKRALPKRSHPTRYNGHRKGKREWVSEGERKIDITVDVKGW